MDEKTKNAESGYRVTYEWMVSATIDVPETDEESARNHEITDDEFKELMKNGEFSKGTIEAIDVFEK